MCVNIGRHEEPRGKTGGYFSFSLLDVASLKRRAMAEGNLLSIDRPCIRDMQTQGTDLIQLNILRINHEEAK
jgi:hypothetical protein